ncbi:MAG: acetyl-CoA C-acetyltransferase [Deltaproteobacteria bacterium]|nr:acetyl-CoA C-acetyltransferase [Candidatus Anaeroferrophillus wilburensis]MBN2888333.1 acetyl-CoA C-acetyltransferase [Deltaproteobacteria bacterium]
MKEVVIVSAVRTAIGTFGGSLKDVPVVDLGATVIRGVLEKVSLRPQAGDQFLAATPDQLKGKACGVDDKYNTWDQSLKAVQVDEVIMGNVVPSAQGQNTARQACVKAGISKEAGAYTVNKVCASGMKAVALASQAIAAGDAEVVIAGGMENMSQIPYAMPGARWGARMFNAEMVDLMVHDGLWEIFYGYHMGVTAENIAELYDISREDQDELALASHQRALAAINNGIFASEIVPVMVPQRKKDPLAFVTDERPMDTTLEKMAKLATVFKKGGTVTAGNASGINDAAAALLLMSREKAESLGLPIKAVIKGYDFGGIDPAYMGLGPIPAIRKLMTKLNMSLADIEFFELNEAFASQALACVRELDLDLSKTNIYGSGISLGHPIGCSGARILVTLLTALEQNNAKRGLASLCIGGGQGAAMVIERP